MNTRKMLPKNSNTGNCSAAASVVGLKSAIGRPQVFEPQLNCRNMGESGRGSDTTGGGWHMRPSIPTRQLGNDYDTLTKPKN